MRTAPLWATQEAILAHDGHGAAARERFAALSAEQKTSLLAYLRTF